MIGDKAKFSWLKEQRKTKAEVEGCSTERYEAKKNS